VRVPQCISKEKKELYKTPIPIAGNKKTKTIKREQENRGTSFRSYKHKNYNKKDRLKKRHVRANEFTPTLEKQCSHAIA